MLHQHAATRQRTRSGNAAGDAAADDKHRAAAAAGAIGAIVAGWTARSVVGWAPARASARAPSRAANDAMAANRRLEVRRRFVTRKVGQTQLKPWFLQQLGYDHRLSHTPLRTIV